MSSTQSFYGLCLQSVAHSLTCCFSGNVPLLHTSRYVIPQWVHKSPVTSFSVADLRGLGRCKCTASNVLHNCTSPSKDYAAVAWSHNNQAQLHTHISVPYRFPDVWLGLELLQDIQFGLPAVLNRDWKWTRQPKIFRMHFGRQWLNPPFWISKSATVSQLMQRSSSLCSCLGVNQRSLPALNQYFL